MRYLILLLLFTGCGRGPSDYAVFESYVDSFVSEGKARHKTIDPSGLVIHLVDTFTVAQPANTVGLCYMGGYKIEVNATYWNNNPSQREELLYHEMGHCLLYLEHTSCPNVMCPYVGDPVDYQNNRSAYLDVLFSS